MKKTLIALCVVCALVACGGPAKEQIEPTSDWTEVTCLSGTHQAGTACIDDSFDEVVVPPSEATSIIDVDNSGTSYVRSVLAILLQDPTMSIEEATTLITSYGGEVIGTIPFAGLYYARFVEATTSDALLAKKTEISADPAIAFVSLDVVIEDPIGGTEREKTTDLEKLTENSLYKPYGDPPNTGATSPLGADGKWAYEKIKLVEAWDAIYSSNPKLSSVIIGMLDGRVMQNMFPTLTFAGSVDLRYSSYESDAAPLAKHGTVVASIMGAPNDSSGITGILGGLNCIHYDFAAMAIWTEAKVCKSDAECGSGQTNRCLKTSNDSDSICYVDCSSDANICPPKQYCSDVNVNGTTQKLCAFETPTYRMLHLASLFGLVEAVKAGARVINVSMGTGCPNDGVMTAEEEKKTAVVRAIAAKAPGTLFVITASNENSDAACSYPCSAARADESSVPNIMCVAATQKNDERTPWSNHDVATPAITIAAPGENILTQLANGNPTLFSGTCAAAPLVSGSAGLLFAILPGLNGEYAKKLLVSQADPINDKTISGKRLNIADAVKEAIRIADKLHPENKGQGECRLPDPKENDAGSNQENACRYKDICWWDIGPQSGSPDWLGYVTITWEDNTTISRFRAQVEKLNGEYLAWTVSFPSQFGPQPPGMTVTHNNIQADVDSETFTMGGGFGSYGGAYVPPGGDSQKPEMIKHAKVDLTFSSTYMTGSIIATTDAGKTVTVPLPGGLKDY